MDDEADRQIGAREKRMLFSRRAEEQTLGGGGDRQMQGDILQESAQLRNTSESLN